MSVSFLFFGILSILAVASAIVTISSKNPVASALSLVFHFFMLAGLYLTLNAQFIAVIQILVYAGAIMVLVVFVIMLLNLGDEEGMKEKLNYKKIIAVMISVILAFLFLSEYFSNPFPNKIIPDIAVEIGSVNFIGQQLFTKYLFPFEAVSLLLLVAIIGAVVLAKRKLD